jgi:Rrf2 family protein
MKLSAQEEYGIRCLLQLAREDGRLSASLIASREGLGEPYVAKLLRLLRGAGLVESFRGQQGGYCLTRVPDEISLADAVRALGADLYSVSSCERFSGDQAKCVHSCECSLRSLWAGIQDVITRLLEECTLGILIRSEQDMATWVETRLAQIARSHSTSS